MKAIGAHQKWLQSQIEKGCGGDMTYAMAGFRPNISKQVANLLESYIPGILSHKIGFPPCYAQLKDDLFAPQGWAQDEFHINVGVTPFGVPECRLLAGGSYALCGVSIEAMPEGAGSTLKEKIEFVLSETGSSEFLELSATPGKGFWMVHDEAFTMIKIPAGHIVLTAGLHSQKEEPKGAQGLRWSLFSDTEHAVRKATSRLQQIMETYPDLKGADYTQWSECLNKFFSAML